MINSTKIVWQSVFGFDCQKEEFIPVTHLVWDVWGRRFVLFRDLKYLRDVKRAAKSFMLALWKCQIISWKGSAETTKYDKNPLCSPRTVYLLRYDSRLNNLAGCINISVLWAQSIMRIYSCCCFCSFVSRLVAVVLRCCRRSDKSTGRETAEPQMTPSEVCVSTFGLLRKCTCLLQLNDSIS